ncbi:MAG: HEPN domain-containing protein [Bacteroidales bacterium]|nr:HEPN domain-containing protein [Bacteroidales bacterium]
MDQLKQKSEFNFLAAELLLKENLYAPSVHCSYYSCLQLIKFSIKDFFGVEYSVLSSNIANSKNINSHKYMIEFVKNELKGNIDSQSERDFSRHIKDLKQFREESDYDDIEIVREMGEKALSLAREVRLFLKQNLHV